MSHSGQASWWKPADSRGALQRLNQVKIRWQDVHGVFLTHLHSDHVVGFPDLWLTGWLTPDMDVPLQVWEPRGTTKMMSHPEQAYEYDIRLIHEVAAPETFQRAGSAPERAKSVIAHHVTPEQVGGVFAQRGIKSQKIRTAGF